MVPEFSCREDAVSIFEALKRLSNDDGRLVYGIFLNEILIGFINDVGISEKEAELGYVIATRYKNQGYATEAFKAAIKEAFDRGISVVLAGAFEENSASIRVMQKCGMTRLDKEELIEYKGVSHRCIYYSIQRT
jgi:RimJ/RimL family protein N-acetyltransferase